MKNKQPMHTQYDISCEVGGKTYTGVYFIDKGMLTVSLPGYGRKSATPSAAPEALARIILGEIARETILTELRGKLYRATREREAWKGKPTEHHKMACLLVESLEKQIATLEHGGPSSAVEK